MLSWGKIHVPEWDWYVGGAQLAVVIGKWKYAVTGVCWVIALSVVAQDSVAVQYRFPNGAVSSSGWLVDGVPAGFWSSYHEDGIRKSEGNWREGVLDGEWIFYDDQGRVETTLIYDQGLKEGEEQRWDTLGVLIRTIPWRRDTVHGVEKVFDARGFEVSRVPWRRGKKEGIAVDLVMDSEGEERIIRRSGYREDLLRWVEDINRFDDQQRKTGKWMTFWPGGRIRSEGPYERGLKEGVFKYFNRNGDLERTETWKRGEQVTDAPQSVALDLRKAFHANGEVSRSGPWREDTPMGTHRFYDEQGHLVEVRVFREGVLHASGSLDSLGRRSGPWVLFWPGGERKAEGEYLDGQRDGSWTFFRLDGTTEQEGSYRSGDWDGGWRWYHEGGALHRDERYRKGREEGEFVELSMTGDTLAVGRYERGLKQGRWIEHVNDDRREGAYLDGEQDGTWRHFGVDGQLRFEGEYVAGVPTGEHVKFWPSGIRAMIGVYEGGLPEGNWRYFDTSGMVKLIRQYKAGRIVKVNGSKTDR